MAALRGLGLGGKMFKKSSHLFDTVFVAVLLAFAAPSLAAPPEGKGGGKDDGETLGYCIEFYDLNWSGLAEDFDINQAHGILTDQGPAWLDYSSRRDLLSCQTQPENWNLPATREKLSRDLSVLHAQGPEVILDLVNTGIAGSRQYPVSSSVEFNGCFGGSDDSDLQLIIEHPKKRSKPHIIRFIWNFGFYKDASVVEYFTLTSERIPIQGWVSNTEPTAAIRWNTDGSTLILVIGTFDIEYSLQVDGTVLADHVSLTGGEGSPLEFWLLTAQEGDTLATGAICQ